MEIHLATFPWLSFTMFSCFTGMFVILFIPPERKYWVRIVSVFFSGLALLGSLVVYLQYDKSLGGFQFVEKYLWVESLGIYYFNGVDGISAPMFLLTGIVLFTGVITMWELDDRPKEFFAFMFLLVGGVYGVFMALDLFFLFVWYDVSLFPMYPLISIWGSTRKEYGAMKLTLYLLAGSVLILPGIIYVYVAAGVNTFDLLAIAHSHLPLDVQKTAFLMFFLGFGVLAAVWPFHTWSPVGHVAAPTAVSMIHAGVLMKLGAYGVLRVGIYLCPQGVHYWANFMSVLATVGIVYGAFVGLAQTDLKYVIGYSSVSHMGMVGLGLSTLTVAGISGATFQMFAHGIMTALFFSATGYIYDKTHYKTIPDLGGLSQTMPVASAFWIIAALCGIGVPCMASFWAELLVFVGTLQVYPVRGFFAIATLVVGALFMLRVVQRTFFNAENPKHAHLSDVSPWLASPRVILVLVLIFFGLFPRLMTDMIQTAVNPLVYGWLF